MTPEEREQFEARRAARGGGGGGVGGGGGGFGGGGAGRPRDAQRPANASSGPNVPTVERGATTIDALFGPLPVTETTGRVWLIEDGHLQEVDVRLGVTDGARDRAPGQSGTGARPRGRSYARHEHHNARQWPGAAERQRWLTADPPVRSGAKVKAVVPVISVSDLTKVYRMGDVEVRALRGVTLSIEAGEFVSVIGPSGSGKSTFMHILGCLDRPTSGRYLLDSQDVSTLSRDELAVVRNQRIGFVFQGFNLLARTSAVDNVELPLLYRSGIRASERHQRAREMLETVGLADRMGHHANQMSGGQQQRVAIARSLINRPSIVLADEPTGNLDSRTSIEIMDIFQRLNRENGITVILITHEHEIAEYGHRIIRFRDGTVVSDQMNDAQRSAGEEIEALPTEGEPAVSQSLAQSS